MTAVTHLKTAAETALAADFQMLRNSLPGNAEIRALRDGAFDLIAEKGLPHRRVENWHYTDLRVMMRDAKPLAPMPSAAAISAAREWLEHYDGLDLTALGACRLVLLDGSFVPSLSDLESLPQNVTFTSTSTLLAGGRSELTARLSALEIVKGDHALSLNSAFMRDGVILEIAAGATIETPLCLVTLHSDGLSAASFTRSLIVLGAGSSVTLLELHAGAAGAEAQANDAIEFLIEDDAVLEHVALQTLDSSTLQLATVTADLGKNSRFNSFALVDGASLCRRQLYVRYSGINAKAALRGVSLLKGRQHADTTLIMDHAVPSGESRELFKHVIDGSATGVFQGKVIVRPHAQKTDGGMKSNALLLSDDGTMNNKPELEIFADDVVCGHGATVGSLDEDLLFYLMARGLPKAEAERLLIQAFAGEAVEFVGSEPVRDALNASVDRWLTER